MDLIQAIHDEHLFRGFLGKLTTWGSWITAHRVLYGLPISKGERGLIQQCTGRTKGRKGGFRTALFLTGRRSGKSRMAAVIGAYEAAIAGREARLAKGERGIVAMISPSRSQSGVVLGYMRSIFDTPMLRNEVESETKDGFDLRNGNRIKILTGDWRTVRGYTLLAAIVDEAAFLGYDSDSRVRSDTELIRAIRPSLATVNGPLIAISSPYARKGWCYKQYKKYFGNNDGSVLVWNCPSLTMNPTLPQSIIDEAIAEDPASARAEYFGEFRDDVETFLPRDLIERVVVKDRKELPPNFDNDYAAFVDLSGGRGDDAALAIAHLDDQKIVIDYLRRWRPPFNPDTVIAEMVADVARYHVDTVTGDNYSAEFTKAGFESRGIAYDRTTANPWSDNPLAKTAKNKSQIYLEMLPRICSGDIELLDNETLIDQLAGLERRTRSGGRDIIDHGPNQHDDLANVVAGVCLCVFDQPLQAFAGGMLSGGERTWMDHWNKRIEDYKAEEDLQRQFAQQPEIPQFFIRPDLSNF